MQFPNTIETHITEQIMKAFSKYSPDVILALEPRFYNQVYGYVHKILKSYGLEQKFCEHTSAVENYKREIRAKYDDRVKLLRSQFPNGMFTKDKDGDLVGINVMLSKFICEMSEVEILNRERKHERGVVLVGSGIPTKPTMKEIVEQIHDIEPICPKLLSFESEFPNRRERRKAERMKLKKRKR